MLKTRKISALILSMRGNVWKKTLRCFIVLCSTVILLSFAGCQQKDPLQEKAQEFLKQALTAPSDKFAEITTLKLGPDDVERNDEYVQKAIEDICSGFVAADVVKDSSSVLYQNILLLQSQAAFEGYTYHVQKVSITKSGDKNYRYEAEFTASNATDKFFLIGSIQFNENDLINYLSIENPS